LAHDEFVYLPATGFPPRVIRRDKNVPEA
jgi:hypothetical protein